MENKPADPTPLAVPIHVGTMGWSYADWNGVFYPDNSENRDWLPLYARVFDTVEIDSTFYGTPRESAVQNWSRTTPDNFVFCAKVPRLITHDMELLDVAKPLSEFVKTMAGLGPKRGPMLFQMPPAFTRDQLDALNALLPSLREVADADAKFAIEFRHASLLTADVFALLKEHNVALAATDYAGMPRRFASTADFAYIRLIGKHGAFKSHRAVVEDRSQMVRRWASVLLRHQSDFREAWIFCNNDYEGFSPATGWKVQEALGLPTRQPASELQGNLF